MATRSGSAVFELLFVFLAVFALQFLATVAQSLTALVGLVGGLFVLSPPITENPWTIVTSVYAHADLAHLLSNAVALLVFGWPVARATTRIRFHTFFLFSGSLSGVAQVLTTVFLAGLPVVEAEPSAVLGASGGVFALLGYLLASNRLSGSLASVVSVPTWVTVGIFLVIAVVLTLATASPGVALFAHFVGLLVGLFAGRLRVLDTGRNAPQPRR